MARTEPRLRLTEILASVSLATDLGTGQPLGHGLRTSLLAVKLAKAMGYAGDDVRSVFQVSLLRFLGCTADAAETATLAGGDDLAFNFEMATVLNGGPVESAAQLMRAVGPGQPPLRRARLIGAALADAGSTAVGLAAHCEVAAMLAQRLGLDDRVAAALRHAYERWDGHGYPSGVKEDAVSFEIRIASVARDVDILQRRGDDVVAVLGRRRGKAYDPTVVDTLLALDGWAEDAEWAKVLEAEPEPVSYVRDLDLVLSVLADFVDLKSPWTRGHSRSVARLAKAAGTEFGLTDTEELGCAALVHDLGRVGVENGVWDKTTRMSIDDWEKARLHTYLTDRILSRCRGLARLGELASSHHERMDGSGYHRQLGSDHLSPEARILAASDVMAALSENRPHRRALRLDDSARVMSAEAAEGRLDRRAVECVVAAAGGAIERVPTANPAGLTDREIEVLALVARGFTNRQVGQELFISAKTVGRHVENIYAKIGVSTRAGAAIFAMETRLLT